MELNFFATSGISERQWLQNMILRHVGVSEATDHPVETPHRFQYKLFLMIGLNEIIAWRIFPQGAADSHSNRV